MRILLVGLGSIGRRHLANLRVLAPDAEIVVWRHAREAGGEQKPDQADRVVYDQQAALDTAPDAAILAQPACFHVPTASTLVRAGVHVLIEKPISHAAAGIDQLLAEAHRQNLVVMVGYNLRFHRALQALRQAVADGRLGKVVSIRAEVGSYLPHWRPGRDYRTVVSARGELGGGAVLELSHELDYVRWLGGEVRAVSARLAELGELGIGVEDTAEITLQFAQGGIGQVHLDMLQRSPTRTCRVIGTQSTAVWDGIAHSAQLYSAGGSGWSALSAPLPGESDQTYLAELRHFLDCVRRGRDPAVTGEDGWRALEIALAAKRSSEEERVIHL